MDSGELLPAVKASMAIPGVFEPVLLKECTLVDGGVVNNLPYESLMDECDVVIAIDVQPSRTKDPGGTSSNG